MIILNIEHQETLDEIISNELDNAFENQSDNHIILFKELIEK